MKQRLTATFRHRYGTEPSVLTRSPGRINLIGEHTDYNDGFVLPGAIPQSAYIALRSRTDDRILLYAEDLMQSYETTHSDMAPIPEGHWANYLLGPVALFAERGLVGHGFEVLLHSEVPAGAGLSSSAAIECAMIAALDRITGSQLDRPEMARMAQQAEHRFAGVQCGIMDMFASLMGKKDHLIRLDCRSFDYEYVPFRFGNVRLLLLDTQVKHRLATSAYNTRRGECRQAVAWIREHFPTVQALRDADRSMVDRILESRDRTIARRARYVVDEIARLHAACSDLEQGNLEAVGAHLYRTHDGLRADYAVSCPELDFLVDSVRGRPGVWGSRMMGGGFGGCTLTLVHEEAIGSLATEVMMSYERAFGKKAVPYVATLSDGTEVL